MPAPPPIWQAGHLELTRSGRANTWCPREPFYVGDYVALVADKPGVVEMVERPAHRSTVRAKTLPLPIDLGFGSDAGVAFIYRQGMDRPWSSTHSAAVHAWHWPAAKKTSRPIWPPAVRSTTRGCWSTSAAAPASIASLASSYPAMRAIVWDRPEVLKVAAEMADEYGVADRLECRPGDMFTDPVPRGADALLVSNVLHDWDVPTNREIIGRLAAALGSGGRLLVHDAFLNDALDGPLAIANYSAALFSLTEGRAYSAAEYRSWLEGAGLRPQAVRPTLVHCGVLPAVRP